MTLSPASKTAAVLGAGIGGLGVARALAKAGYAVTIFERNAKIAAETSDNSLRIIHGGFRYLQQFAILRIIDSIRDQNFCLRQYPDLVKPMASVMPLNRFGLKSFFPVKVAGSIYGILLRIFSSPLAAPRILLKDEAEELFPWNIGAFNYGALLWNDAELICHRDLVTKICEELRVLNVSIETESPISKIENNAQGVTASIASEPPRARNFALCVEALGHNANAHGARFDCGFTLGFNLVFKKTFAIEHALGFSGEEGRLFFLVPRNNLKEPEIALGTEYVAYEGILGPTEGQIQAFFDAALRACPQLPLRKGDLLRIESGVLPTEEKGSLRLKGRTEIKTEGKIISLLPSKYTTFKSVGERVSKIAKSLVPLS